MGLPAGFPMGSPSSLSLILSQSPVEMLTSLPNSQSSLLKFPCNRGPVALLWRLIKVCSWL